MSGLAGAELLAGIGLLSWGLSHQAAGEDDWGPGIAAFSGTLTCVMAAVTAGIGIPILATGREGGMVSAHGLVLGEEDEQDGGEEGGPVTQHARPHRTPRATPKGARSHSRARGQSCCHVATVPTSVPGGGKPE